MLNGIFQWLTYLQKLLTYFFSSLNVSGPFIIDFLHPQLLSISEFELIITTPFMRESSGNMQV